MKFLLFDVWCFFSEIITVTTMHFKSKAISLQLLQLLPPKLSTH